MISIVCPFYNEEAILSTSINKLITNLSKLNMEWELILVNDGSTDGSSKIVYSLINNNPGVRIISYNKNMGRGHAIRKGIFDAQGDTVISTEIDSSWGDDIFERIYHAFNGNPDADIIVASPHLPGGGFRNVPYTRIILSKYANSIIRTYLKTNISMNTGMTRGYKKEKFVALSTTSDGKEMHLEIIIKARESNYKIYEIPAIIDWKHRTNMKHKSIHHLSAIIRDILAHIILLYKTYWSGSGH